MTIRRSLLVSVVALSWLVLLPSTARPDAGVVVLREARGPIVVTLMAGPAPLRGGSVELEALVQSRASGAPDLDATTTLHVTGPNGYPRLEVSLRPGAGGNGLLRGVLLDLERSGAWQVVLDVGTAVGHEERFETALSIAPPRRPVLQHWAAISAGPAGLAILALHQALCLTRRPRQRA